MNNNTTEEKKLNIWDKISDAMVTYIGTPIALIGIYLLFKFLRTII